VGALSITANVPGAGVIVDDRLVWKLPLDAPIFVDPGSHKVRVSAPGYQDSAREVQVAAGESMTWDVELKPAAPAPPSAQGKPGTSENTVTPVTAPLKVTGSSAPRGAPREQEGRSSPLENRANPVLLGIGAGAGILGFTLGTAFLAAGINDYHALEELTLVVAGGYRPPDCIDSDAPGCANVRELSKRADHYIAVGIVGMVIGSAGTALAFGELVEFGAEPKADGAPVAFVVTPGGGALVFKGKF
jgi:hypothetical protein